MAIWHENKQTQLETTESLLFLSFKFMISADVSTAGYRDSEVGAYVSVVSSAKPSFEYFQNLHCFNRLTVVFFSALCRWFTYMSWHIVTWHHTIFNVFSNVVPFGHFDKMYVCGCSFGWKAIKWKNNLMICISLDMASIPNCIDSLIHSSSQWHYHTQTHTHITLTGTLPPPDILLAQTRPPTLSPQSKTNLHPLPLSVSLLQDYCALLFRHPHITQNKWVPYFPLSPPTSPPPPSFLLFSLALFLSFALCRWKAGIEPAVAFQNLRPRLQCVWLFNTAGSH